MKLCSIKEVFRIIRSNMYSLDSCGISEIWCECEFHH